MNLKLVSTAAVAALTLLSIPAFAATNLGLIGSGYSNSGSLGPVDGPQIVDFTLNTTDFVQLSATVSNTSVHLGDTSLLLKGPEDFSSKFVKTSNWSAAIGSVFPGVELTAGNYSFTFSPAAAGTANVGYSISLTGVPEISTWAMMLAGFGAIGFAGYRRRPVIA